MHYHFFMKVLASLSTLDLVIVLSIVGALILGALIFFLAGLHHPPKNHAIIIERAGLYDSTYDSGTHFKMPIVYQKVGVYCIVPQVRKYIAQNGNHLDVTFQIMDVKKYHYCGYRFEEIMRMIEKENSEINLTILTDKFEQYGLKFIGIKKSLN